MEERKIPRPLSKPDLPCVNMASPSERTTPGKIPICYNALPRDCKFAYLTPGYYATGFKILDVYKTEMDFTEIRRLLFLEEDDAQGGQKWANLRARVPYSSGRIVDLPGTSDLHFKNYYLRSLTPESAASWRKSIVK